MNSGPCIGCFKIICQRSNFGLSSALAGDRESTSAAAGRSSRRAGRGALGSGCGPYGSAWSGRPARARPDVRVHAAISGPTACTSALRITRQPQRSIPFKLWHRCFGATLNTGQIKSTALTDNFRPSSTRDKLARKHETQNSKLKTQAGRQFQPSPTQGLTVRQRESQSAGWRHLRSGHPQR
ncbi:hypothetical protein JOE09_001926 [Pantoea coffeiphila]|nr:hypothetical protein [Pantoea coffeiphila]